LRNSGSAIIAARLRALHCRSREMRTFWLSLLCLSVAGCAVSRVDPLTVPLAYRASSASAGALGTLSCNTIAQLQVTDARTDKTLGTRVHESKPLKADVSAGGDPTTWARDGVHNVLTQNGVRDGSGGPALTVAIDTVQTTESIWHRSSYGATVALTAQLTSASGKSCFRQTGSGKSVNYGYSGSIENYQETLNEALERAVVAMAQSQGFKDALCHCGE
jgi:hypothetical protein